MFIIGDMHNYNNFQMIILIIVSEFYTSDVSSSSPLREPVLAQSGGRPRPASDGARRPRQRRGGAGRLPDTAVARRTGTDGWWTSRWPQLHCLLHTSRLNNSIYATWIWLTPCVGHVWRRLETTASVFPVVPVSPPLYQHMESWAGLGWAADNISSFLPN